MRNTFTPVCEGRAPRPKTKHTLSEIVVRKYSLVFFRLSTASFPGGVCAFYSGPRRSAVCVN